MKLKTVEVDGKMYAEVLDGKPVFVGEDGKEAAFDAVATKATISRMFGENKSYRERAEAAESKVKLFEGIEDPEAAKVALETVKDIDAGKLVQAGKVEEVKAAALKAAEDQFKGQIKQLSDAKTALETERDTFRSQLHEEIIGGSFARSKFITEKVAVPGDMLRATFGNRFKVEDGKLVAIGQDGNPIYSKTRMGDPADFDEAIEILIDQYPYRDNILKGSGANGGGAQPSGGGAGKKSMGRAAFEALDPAGRAEFVKGGGTVTQ
ncbi:DUF6651 domain-containing protein [Parapusillimonas sp. JC17]|uniref:DUF6651 domain-containing protein n=1 Tax=Parapusillimonas sp. JC17 TaxID=3445768 RepID=UPI003F9EE606